MRRCERPPKNEGHVNLYALCIRLRDHVTFVNGAGPGVRVYFAAAKEQQRLCRIGDLDAVIVFEFA